MLKNSTFASFDWLRRLRLRQRGKVEDFHLCRWLGAAKKGLSYLTYESRPDRVLAERELAQLRG